MVVKGSAGIKLPGISGATMVEGETKKIAYRPTQADGQTRLKSLPSATMSQEQRQQMLASIKGQASMTQLKEQLDQAEAKASSLENEKRNLSEQLAFAKQ